MPLRARTAAGRVSDRFAALASAAFAIVLAAVLLIPAAPAPAKSPGDFSAADQYVETLPTPQGPSATKTRKDRRTRLSAGVAAKLRAKGGKDASALEIAATSSDFGAPQKNGRGADKSHSRSTDSPAVPTASVKAVSNSGEDLLWLLIVLIAITGLMVGAVAYQRHKNSKSG
jgi:hypothetical protein